ncbi:hypothetical protein SDC9_101100 [bioreactor metagenome]|uniref:Uncharacterized protein n=1 Tax=bioreactor metagenome TaxID=1076179 RepID=A0A645AM41_9ZZZZ
MSSLFSLGKFKACTANHDLMSVFNKMMNEIFEVKHAWAAIYQSDIVDTE